VDVSNNKDLDLPKAVDNDIQSKNNNPKKPLNLMIRSNSEERLRDKEFYEMCDEEDEIAMYCKY